MLRSLLLLAFEKPFCTSDQAMHNKKMSTVGEEMEWVNMNLKQIWISQDFSRMLKVRMETVALIYKVTALLWNLKVCINGGGQVKSYFICAPPIHDRSLKTLGVIVLDEEGWAFKKKFSQWPTWVAPSPFVTVEKTDTTLFIGRIYFHPVLHEVPAVQHFFLLYYQIQISVMYIICLYRDQTPLYPALIENICTQVIFPQEFTTVGQLRHYCTNSDRQHVVSARF